MKKNTEQQEQNQLTFHIEYKNHRDDNILPFCPASYDFKDLINAEKINHYHLQMALKLGFKLCFIVDVKTIYEKMFNSFRKTKIGGPEHNGLVGVNESIKIMINDWTNLFNQEGLQKHILEYKEYLTEKYNRG